MRPTALILGGTGAMGGYLVELLAEKYEVIVTSRSHRESENAHVSFLQGNAKNLEFLEETVRSKTFDVVVDFMVHDASNFSQVIDLMLAHTHQYFFISSARVYADTKTPITEESPRLLDVSQDQEYLGTQEYALSKAREENVLFAKKEQGQKNFTIIRPSLTYSSQRLQLGVLEKENWLMRALDGRPIVFSKDLMDKHYTMTTGRDVAKGIAALCGQQKALGEAYHIVQAKSYSWREILQVYLDTLEEQTGKRPDVFFTEKSTNLMFKNRRYQVMYGRYFDRYFDNSKISEFIDTTQFEDPKQGLRDCLTKFLKDPKFMGTDWPVEAMNDRVSGCFTPLSKIKGARKIQYLCYRMNWKWPLKLLGQYQILE